ncbi:hypothetical protein [Pseudozobellia thermophila]|uniref:Uncharacterized protein n=1 Tax=Pseudozobellia thermophila TaxID=192903 RepID=A0A1M6M1J2_9FLAO|nr:hypothetical protein [Pseudozobellia thermophila]SHJ77349.1 hypothetical protein SAMN04488513_108137 [Pseudozobellia thermophila]
MNEKILKNKDFEDGLGNTTIWDRIKKAGENKFYRVEYRNKEKDESKLSVEQKKKRREESKKYVEGEGKKLLINTTFANTDYVNNVIKAYVYGDPNAEKQLYEEPVLTDKEQADIDRLIKQLGQNDNSWKEILNKEMQDKPQVKQDNTAVKILKRPLKPY